MRTQQNKCFIFILISILFFWSEAFSIVTPLCQSVNVDFNNSGDKRYYEIYIEQEGKNLLVTFDGSPSSSSSLYIKYNQIPTESEYDDHDVLEEDPAVGIYGTQPGYYYVMLKNGIFSKDGNYILTPCTNLINVVNGVTDSFNNSGDKRYYEVYAEEGKNLSVIFDGPPSSSSSLYIKYNQIPTESDYDDHDVLEEDPAVGVYDTQKGYYYIMLKSGISSSAGENYILRAYSASNPPDIPLIRGDADGNGKLDIKDIVYILQVLTDIRP